MSNRGNWTLLFAAAGILIFSPAARSQVTSFQQTNLVSSVVGQAPVTDPNLRNPWGIAVGPSTPFWIANEVTSTSTVYNGAGQPFPVGNPLIVSIPALGNPRGPTGVAFNSTSNFLVNGTPASFIFANRDGTIEAWNASAGTSALVMTSSVGALNGLTIGNNGTANFLYAANAGNATISVFNSSFQQTTLAGNFTDPNLPGGFAPHNIQNIGGTLFVTYKNAAGGGGVIDAFSPNGIFLRRVTANGAGGHLDAPWGMAIAPASFGTFGGALLVGNEGDGRISAFDSVTGQFLGQLSDSANNPIANPGLWGLTFGNGGNGGSPNTLYFAAGIQGETHGLFGSISPVPEPSSVILLGVAAIVAAKRGRKNRVAFSSPRTIR